MKLIYKCTEHLKKLEQSLSGAFIFPGWQRCLISFEGGVLHLGWHHDARARCVWQGTEPLVLGDLSFESSRTYWVLSALCHSFRVQPGRKRRCMPPSQTLQLPSGFLSSSPSYVLGRGLAPTLPGICYDSGASPEFPEVPGSWSPRVFSVLLGNIISSLSQHHRLNGDGRGSEGNAELCVIFGCLPLL